MEPFDDTMDALADEFADAFTKEILDKSTIEILKETFENEKNNGKLRDFVVELMQSDELLLEGVFNGATPTDTTRA